jgi:hypothetical protein
MFGAADARCASRCPVFTTGLDPVSPTGTSPACWGSRAGVGGNGGQKSIPEGLNPPKANSVYIDNSYLSFLLPDRHLPAPILHKAKHLRTNGDQKPITTALPDWYQSDVISLSQPPDPLSVHRTLPAGPGARVL